MIRVTCRVCGTTSATHDRERCERRFARAKAEAAPAAATAQPQPAVTWTFPVAGLDASAEAELPIQPVKGAPVAKQVGTAKVVGLGAMASIELVTQKAAEYEAMKQEAERIAGKLAQLGDFLKTELQRLPGERVAVGERFLGRVVAVSESFRLEDAKKVKALRPLLKPYTEIIEKFDLKAARKHIDEATLAKFVTAHETVSLRFLKGKGDE